MEDEMDGDASSSSPLRVSVPSSFVPSGLPRAAPLRASPAWSCWPAMGAITSAELNFLVFRYLQESGFVHTAFTLGYEAGIHKGGIDENVVPPGALITVVQKGFQYIELEANTDENDEEVEKDFALLEPLEITTKDVEELQQIVKKRKRERLESDRDKDKGKDEECTEEHERRPGGERERECHDKEKEQEREKARTERDWEQEQEKEKEKQREKQHAEHIDKVKHKEDPLAGGGRGDKKFAIEDCVS